MLGKNFLECPSPLFLLLFRLCAISIVCYFHWRIFWFLFLGGANDVDFKGSGDAGALLGSGDAGALKAEIWESKIEVAPLVFWWGIPIFLFPVQAFSIASNDGP